jgi:hypothetical protein
MCVQHMAVELQFTPELVGRHGSPPPERLRDLAERASLKNIRDDARANLTDYISRTGFGARDLERQRKMTCLTEVRKNRKTPNKFDNNPYLTTKCEQCQ